MKPKPLKLSGIKRWVKKDLVIKTGDIDRAIDLTLHKTKERIKLACNFYRKYISRPDLLMDEHPELAKIEIDYESADDVLKEIKRIEDVYGITETQATIRDKLMDYNLWLFKLAFRDVLYTKTVRGWIK